MKKQKGLDSLLEIGTEEIPARFIPPALAALKTKAEEALTASGLTFDEVRAVGTPRRLALLITGLPVKAQDRDDIAVGPPPKAAKTPEGEWTKAATGFAKAQKIPVSKLVLQNTPKGERYVAVHAIKGQKTEVALKNIFPALVSGLYFPKTMRWNSTEFRFARPIRWFIGLLNSKVVRFSVAEVKADRSTFGLLALGGKKISVARPDRYVPILQSRCILVDPEERKKKILAHLDSLGKKIKGKPIVEEEHLEEVVYLTEYPTGILGRFPEEYLALPREVLVSSMRKHQKFFPLESGRKKLANAFIGIRNGPTDAHESVRDGYERVLNARLADAKFFYDTDVKIPLEKFSDRLDEITVHEKLGTLSDKKERVASLVETLGRLWGYADEDISQAVKAARLSKADLLTQMVGEFPELQGVAGRFYASAQGEQESVAAAIEEHYWPLTADGELPASAVGALVSAADKWDNLAMNFYVGNAPSGSADPYGLRRAAVGLIRIMIDRQWTVSFKDGVDAAFNFPLYAENSEARKNELLQFLFQRFAGLFSNQGYRPDEIDAVLGNGSGLIFDLQEKLKSIKTVRGKPEFLSLAAALKRTQNILRQAQTKGLHPNGVSLDEQKLTETSEKSLLQALNRVRPLIDEAVTQRKYQDALFELSKLKQPVDAFFDGVMVMVDNPELRSQRLALLQGVESLFGSVADFSKLQGASTQKN